MGRKPEPSLDPEPVPDAAATEFFPVRAAFLNPFPDLPFAIFRLSLRPPFLIFLTFTPVLQKDTLTVVERSGEFLFLLNAPVSEILLEALWGGMPGMKELLWDLFLHFSISILGMQFLSLFPILLMRHDHWTI